MSCEQFIEAMSPYLDEMLEGDDQIQFEAHLESCMECRQEFEQFKAILDEIHEMPMKELPQNYHQELMEKIHEVSEAKSKNSYPIYKNWKMMSTIAASFIFLVLVIGTLNTIGLNGKKESDTKSAAPESYDTAKAAEAPKEFKAKEDINSQVALEKDSKANTADGIQPRSDAQTAIQSDQAQLQAKDEGHSETTLEKAPEANASDETKSQSEPQMLMESNQADGADIRTIYNIELSLEVKDFDSAINSIDKISNQNGGSVEESYSKIYYSEPNENLSLRQGTITIKVPSDKYEVFKNQIESIDHFIGEEENNIDVTDKYHKAQNKIQSLELERENLLESIKMTDETEELDKLKEQLNKVQRDLEAYNNKIKNWDQLMLFSTFKINIKEIR